MGLRDWTRRNTTGSATGKDGSAAGPAAALDQARHLERAGRLDDARQRLEAALAEYPNDPDLRREYWELCSRLDAEQEARAEAARAEADEAPPDAPIELSDTTTKARDLRRVPAVPKAVDGERLTLEFPNQPQGNNRRHLALSGVQALAAVRIEESPESAHVLIDLFLDSLWADVETLRTVRLSTAEFDPLDLVPEAGDAQLALGTFLENLLASSGAQPLPDAESAVGRPFPAFASVREYERRLLEVGG